MERFIKQNDCKSKLRMNWSTDVLWNVRRCPRIGKVKYLWDIRWRGEVIFNFLCAGGREDRSFLEQLAIEANLILFYCETTYIFVCFNCITYTDYHKLGTLTLKTGCIWPLLIIFVQSLAELIIHKVITELKFCLSIFYFLIMFLDVHWKFQEWSSYVNSWKLIPHEKMEIAEEKCPKGLLFGFGILFWLNVKKIEVVLFRNKLKC